MAPESINDLNTSLLSLPYELTSSVLSFLNPNDIHSLHLTCKQLHATTRAYVRTLIIIPGRLPPPFTELDILAFEGFPKGIERAFKAAEFDPITWAPPPVSQSTRSSLERPWKKFITEFLVKDWLSSHILCRHSFGMSDSVASFVLQWEYRIIMEGPLGFAGFMYGIGVGRDYLGWKDVRASLREELRAHPGFCVHGHELDDVCYPCLQRAIMEQSW
ncbi:hypothetical protein YB2330_006162 [Saitoella coloradoensis]